MSIEERLTLFQEMICCSYKVYRWTYDAELGLIQTNCPYELIASDMITILNFSSTIMQQARSDQAYPVILDTDFGLIWIAAFEIMNKELHRIHIIGPAFTGRNSQLLVKKKLDSYNISMKLRLKIFKQMDDVPIIPTNLIYQYATMLHYCITNIKISTNDLCFATNGDRKENNEVRLISEEHRGIWLSEQNFLSMIREGNVDYMKALEKSMALSSGVKADYGDSMRSHKNNALVLLTLCSRASIEGGLSPSIAYSMNDYYAKLIEECKNISETTSLSNRFMDDYVKRVAHSKNDTHISGQVQAICDYISIHIKEKISLSDMARQVGYTEYYLSQKFKKEMGVTVNAYIKLKKIDEAKLLLSGTKMSIQDISDELSFGNRSHFYTSFHKVLGTSPSQYREANYRS